MDDPFGNDCTVITPTVRVLVDWFTSDGVHRLRLPPIQRSLVWRNNQIVNYWDSLLRGYPGGTMMVVRAKAGVAGRDKENSTHEVAEGEYHLLDGQQRLFAILLGMGTGPLAETRRVWVDPARAARELLLGLRVNSTGNPFGYTADDPNAKPAVAERRKALEAWKEHGETACTPPDIFACLKTRMEATLIGSERALSLPSLLGQETPDMSAGLSPDQCVFLSRALSAHVTVCLCPDTVLGKDDYPRFFARLGQGGTRLTDDELVYSLIKRNFPSVHDEVEKIAKVARLVAPVDLVMAALRVAKSEAPTGISVTKSPDDSRPTPDFVRKLQLASPVLQLFNSMLDCTRGNANLFDMVTTLNRLLRHSSKAAGVGASCENRLANQLGLPAMLMADLPAHLLDVLLLFAFRHHGTEWEPEEQTALIAFVLYWLVFCGDVAKAASAVYRALRVPEATAEVPSPFRFSPEIASWLISRIEAEGAADLAPRQADMDAAKCAVNRYGAALRDWNGRFAADPTTQEQRRGTQALRVVTSHGQRLKRLLMWVQRHYLAAAFPNYDPTSIHDEDLPFDLDHLIPSSLFGANAQTFEAKLSDLSDVEKKLLRDQRRLFGNSLGNFRWLAFSDNRSRGAGEISEIVERTENTDGIRGMPTDARENAHAFNTLIATYNIQGWNKAHLTDFQKPIDIRALDLIGHLLEDSTLGRLLENAGLPSAAA